MRIPLGVTRAETYPSRVMTTHVIFVLSSPVPSRLVIGLIRLSSRLGDRLVQMAEGWAKHLAKNDLEIWSSGLEGSRVHPTAKVGGGLVSFSIFSVWRPLFFLREGYLAHYLRTRSKQGLNLYPRVEK